MNPKNERLSHGDGKADKIINVGYVVLGEEGITSLDNGDMKNCFT